MKNGLTITRDKMKKVLLGISSLPAQDVLVGVPGEFNHRKGEEITNSTIGFINEFGSPDMNIPARPFLVPGVRDARTQIESRFKKAGASAIAGDTVGMMRQLHIAGGTARDSVKNKIDTGPFQALSPRTLAARRARGVTRTKPLLDTTALQGSINYVIRERK